MQRVQSERTHNVFVQCANCIVPDVPGVQSVLYSGTWHWRTLSRATPRPPLELCLGSELLTCEVLIINIIVLLLMIVTTFKAPFKAANWHSSSINAVISNTHWILEWYLRSVWWTPMRCTIVILWCNGGHYGTITLNHKCNEVKSTTVHCNAM